ncbi:ABC transporter permease [Rhodococcus sp. ARC_M6]|uniref:ABC transporter permease n=1 Tax=Rhodococcus sp. ARC_M6 TaxID=2928852 RepID=UPI001FB54999|nr:ABC transporter permease [Rhodococcus sp. ARC_M6]MCJ0903658.1 ABC transporter permease [Rhodococcus sp. ARC_M6]
MTTTTTQSRAVPKAPTQSRIGSVLRLHTVAWPLLIAWPVGILLVSFLISFTIYAIVGNEQDEGFTGSVFSAYGFVLAFYLQSMAQTFPFALGLSVTRREFFTATAVMAVAQSAVFATVLFLLSIVESATNGWGVHMRMFGIARYFTDNAAEQLLALFATLLLTSSVAMLTGAIYQRWRTSGLLTALTVLFGTLGLSAIVITWARWWPAIGSWFVDVPRVVPMTLLPLTLAIGCLAGAWATLRRATP